MIRGAGIGLIGAFLLLGSGCGGITKPEPKDIPTTSAAFPDPTEKNKPLPGFLKNEIPPDQLEAVLRAHFQGLGFMERYEYPKAITAFREVHERAPGWIPGSINLAIALLNDSGTRTEEAKTGAGSSSFDGALELLDAVLGRDPQNLYAHYCRGLILVVLGQGRTSEAHNDFQFVADHDPTDGHAWLKAGETLTSKLRPNQPAGPDQAEELITYYEHALKCNPNLVTALYKLQQAYGWARQRQKQTELLQRWRQLNPKSNPAGAGDTSEPFYGESGRYSRVIDPFPAAKPAMAPIAPPRFELPTPIQVKLQDGDRWAKADDFRDDNAFLGRARERFGVTVVSADLNGDGRPDLILGSAIVGPKGLRDALLINQGDAAFVEASRDWNLPEDLPSLGIAAADFDADRHIDLFLTSRRGYRVLRNLDGKRFEDISAQVGMNKAGQLGLAARWLDLDQDGDLDLYVVNHTDLDHAGDAFGKAEVPKVVNAAFRNTGKPAAIAGRPRDNWAPVAVTTSDLPATSGLSLAFEPWPDADALVGPPSNFTGVAALDVDDDRDLDLVVAAEGMSPRAILNDRLGSFHALPLFSEKADEETSRITRLLVIDLDKDGRGDLVSISTEGVVRAWRNRMDFSNTSRVLAWENWPIDAREWRSALAIDIDLDTWPDLVGLPASKDIPSISWARNDGARLVTQKLLVSFGDAGNLSGFVMADFVGDPLADLLLCVDGGPPRIARNLGNGRHWLAVDLGGRWKTSFDHMRTNPHGLGTRMTLEGQGLLVTHDQTTPSTGLGQSIGPVVLGLGQSPSVELVRLRWPDGTMQCELNQPADVLLKISETNRKTGSCPVLFTWNGVRFVCLGDFLGGGGLGYLNAPGVYGQPDRDESVAITSDQLQPVEGLLRLSIVEPMDEVSYLDHLTLKVIDRPPGVSTTPDERFSPDGQRPTGQPLAWTRSIVPEQARDLAGRDVLAALRDWDRVTVDGFRKLNGWVGYAEEHGIILDFGAKLAGFGPNDPLILVLAGWVEYPYSQTNYAAATAGVALKPPQVERRNDDGTWTVIEPNAGYPAGLPRQTTLDLTGKLNGPRCQIRLRTNMECYWDQAFLAVRDPSAEASLRVKTLPVGRASLGHRGYLRESSPDARDPLLYDYDHVDPAPFALMAGMLTRYGDVRDLLNNDDDQLCLVGPGDEVRLEFDTQEIPKLPEGWSRSYLLHAVGYCKDADPFTATSDRVDPLPWRGMPAFPFADKVRRKANPAYQGYLDRYQTRPAGAR